MAWLYNSFGNNVMSPQREAALTESWRKTLSGIPTMLGRVAYLASLRNANTGIYEHFGLAQRVGPEEVDRLIRRSHSELFQEWLCYGLERQKNELEEYFAGIEGDKREILANWLTIGPFIPWIPADSRDVERRLFTTDLAVVLELIRADYGVASRDPES